MQVLGTFGDKQLEDGKPMNDRKVISKVSEECASKVVWEVAKTMGKAGIAAGALGAGAGSMSIAIPGFAG